MSLAILSDGLSESICSADMAGALASIRARIVGVVTEYVLDVEPAANSLSVTLDGAVVPVNDINGYTYIPATHTVRFNGNYIPKENQVVTIHYQPATSH